MIRPAFVVGGLMAVTGAFVVYGAVTGNLAAMLAAIFDPGVLGPSTAKKPGNPNANKQTPGLLGNYAVEPAPGKGLPPVLFP